MYQCEIGLSHPLDVNFIVQGRKTAVEGVSLAGGNRKR